MVARHADAEDLRRRKAQWESAKALRLSAQEKVTAGALARLMSGIGAGPTEGETRPCDSSEMSTFCEITGFKQAVRRRAVWVNPCNSFLHKT
jgi:hypothetical protein